MGFRDNCNFPPQAQTASPTFTHVYAALAAIINTKFPNIGELLLKRLILNFKRGFKRNDKTRCTSSVRFIGHMVNQQVSGELCAQSTAETERYLCKLSMNTMKSNKFKRTYE